MVNKGYQNSETPEPTVTKFGTGDQFGDITTHAKIQSDRPTAAYRQVSEILLSHGF